MAAAEKIRGCPASAAPLGILAKKLAINGGHDA
jgi:hypothetical protein